MSDAQKIDPQIATWLARLAEVIESEDLASFNAEYGVFDIAEILITFDNEPSGLSIIPNEHGSGFDIRISGSPA